MNHKHGKQIDNRGFSLVELLVAILILAIVVVPLLHTFVSSARTNMLARRRLRVTTAAQDIMEGLKADTIEELSYQFNYPDVSHAANPDIKEVNEFHVVSRGMIHGDIKELRSDDGVTFTEVEKGESAGTEVATTASTFSTDNGVNYKFIGHPAGAADDGIYYFSLEDVTMQSANFDALIRIDATPYRGDKTDPTKHNAQEVVSITNMNTKYDAFYVQDPDLVKQVVQKYNAKYAPTPEIKAEDLKMTIRIKTENTVASEKNLTKVTISYEFELPGATDQPDIEEHIIFNNVETGKDLEEVYLFYYPMYQAAGRDTIIYENDDQVPATFYIIKQEPQSVTAQLQADEMSYHCDVKIQETGIAGVADRLTNIRTNLDYNLWNAYLSGVPGTTLTQAAYYYNGGPSNKIDFEVKNLTGLEAQDRIFDVTISIYEPGAAAAGFPADDRITTIEGSKDN